MTGTTAESRVAGAASEDRSRWLALYVLCVGMLMIVLDATIVNVALPSIKGDLAARRRGKDAAPAVRSLAGIQQH